MERFVLERTLRSYPWGDAWARKIVLGHKNLNQNHQRSVDRQCKPKTPSKPPLPAAGNQHVQFLTQAPLLFLAATSSLQPLLH